MKESKSFKSSGGFSLIELLVSIAIIAMLVGLALPNFLGARQRARDARRKAEMLQLKNALQLYANDYSRYPADSGGPVYDKIKGCKTAGTEDCPCSATLDFAAGGAGCDTVYMPDFPEEFGTSMFYYQRQSGDKFCLKVALENASDTDIAKSQSRCAAVCTGVSLSGSDYVACSD